MVSEWQPWQQLPFLHSKQSNHVAVKLLASAFLVGLSFRLFFSPAGTQLSLLAVPRSFAGTAHNPPNGSPATENTPSLNASILKKVVGGKETSQEAKCDIFTGVWVPNPSGPTYTNASCRFIEPPQNCMLNGRPDTGYLYWRWKPNACEVPLFNADRFLDSMSNKSWALVGDSILRNHVQSLICLLSKKEEPTEVYHDETYKCRRWHFPSHNFTLSLVWSPFLVKADVFEDDQGVSTSDTRLHLDAVDTKWMDQYDSFDYVVMSTGQWFQKTAIYLENNTVIGCHYCRGKNLTEVGFDYAFRKALHVVFRFVTTSAHKPVVFYRTWTPQHFENGEWFSGGTCNRTRPYRKGEIVVGKDLDYSMWRIEVEEFEKAASLDESGNAGRLKLLNTFELTLQRPDGHPGPYRTFQPFDKVKNASVQNDCLHWCLPGPIDTWNDLMMQMLLN